MKTESSRRRLFAAAAVAVVVAVLGILSMSSVGENLVYYWSPSELLDAGDQAVGATIRLGGLVEDGSIDRGADGLTLAFAVTDGERSVPVVAEAVPPAMFREGIGVVVEGTLRTDGRFETRRLMVKHDNQYQAPEMGQQVDMEKLVESMPLDG